MSLVTRAQESSVMPENKMWNVSLELTILNPEAFGCMFRISAEHGSTVILQPGVSGGLK